MKDTILHPPCSTGCEQTKIITWHKKYIKVNQHFWVFNMVLLSKSQSTALPITSCRNDFTLYSSPPLINQYLVFSSEGREGDVYISCSSRSNHSSRSKKIGRVITMGNGHGHNQEGKTITSSDHLVLIFMLSFEPY